MPNHGERWVRDLLKCRDGLEEFCETHFLLGTQPETNLTLANNVAELSIGNICVWDTESGYMDEKEVNDDDNHPNPQRCIECYKRLIEQITPDNTNLDGETF